MEQLAFQLVVASWLTAVIALCGRHNARHWPIVGSTRSEVKEMPPMLLDNESC
jgi:hypothetical protein